MAYEILIRNETADGGKAKSPIAGNGAQAADTTAQGNKPAISEGRIAAAKGIYFVNGYIKPFVDKMITQKISTVALRTGAQELEDRMSFAYQVGQKAFGFVQSVIIGGLVGNLPGAIIGGVMNLAMTAVEYSNKQERLNLERDNENISLRFMNLRAGGSVASFSGSRMKSQ